MQSVEITAKSLDEARRQAAAQLGVSEDALSVTVLEETKGLFGKSNVRIRAEADAQAKSEPAKPAKAAPAEEAPAEAPAAVVEEEVASPAEAKRPSRRGRGAKREEKREEEAPATAEAAPEPEAAAPVAEAGEEPRTGVDATEQDGEQLLALVQDLLKSGDLNVSAKVTGLNGRYVNIELDGRDAAHLVGKHGEVLNAMQYLVNIIANQKFGNGVRATLDGNNYRRRREEALEKLASSIADQVKARGEEAVLDALPAFERRIVHKTLAGYEGVTTYSEGEEPNRRVVIAPAE